MARERVLSSSLSKEYFEEDSRTVLTNPETLDYSTNYFADTASYLRLLRWV